MEPADWRPVDRVTIRVPIGGMFPSLFHYAPGLGPEFESLLEPGCVWRRPTDADRDLIATWFDIFKEFHSEDAAKRGTYESTVLAADDPLDEDPEHMQAWSLVTTSLILAATLCTDSSYFRYQTMRFSFNDGHQNPKSGSHLFETLRLGRWGGPSAIELTPTLVDSIVGLYPYVRRAMNQPIDHRFKRALSAYRVATTSTRFSDHLPVLLCASLEALTGEDEMAKVAHLVEGFATSGNATDRLKRLYLNRQWFAHGADVPEMREAKAREQSLDDGLTVVKEIIRNALRDDVLFEVAYGPARDVRRHLDERS